jgi:hypothetical protein
MPIISPIDPIANAKKVDPNVIITFDLLSTNINDLTDPTTVIIEINGDTIWQNETAATGWDVNITPSGNSYRYYVTNFVGFSFNEDVEITISINSVP